MVVLPLPDRDLLLVLQDRVLDRFVNLLRSEHETLRQEDVQKLQFGHFLGFLGGLAIIQNGPKMMLHSVT